MRPFKKLTLRAKLKRLWHWAINYKYWRVYRFVSHCIYWLRTHTINRYHIVNLKSPANGYRFGWLDRDNAMFLAMFRILCDFVERELFAQSSIPSIAGIKLNHKRALERIEAEEADDPWVYNITKQQFEITDKLLDLYWWFKTDHPKLIKDDDWDELYAIETRKMKELVELRSGLWT